MQPVRGLPFLLTQGMRVALTPPSLSRDRFCRVRTVGEGGCVSFSGIDDIGSAEDIVGCYVLASTSDIELGPLDAPFDHLMGREVIDARAGVIGQIVEVMETPANDVWVVQGGSFGEVLVPVVEQVVASIPQEGAIPVDLPDGLVDMSRASAGGDCA